MWTLLFFGTSVVFHLLARHVHRFGYTAYPLSPHRYRFYDFTIFTEKFRFFHTPAFWTTGFPINYPAPCIAFFELFFGPLRPHALLAFVTFCVLVFVIPAALLGRAFVRRGVSPGRAALFVSTITLFSWPAVLLVDGANAETLVWLTLLMGMWAYATGRLWTAAVFFGLGVSVKLFPFVLFGLFLSRRQYSQILVGAAVFLTATVASLALVGPTITGAYRGVAMGLLSFRQNYMAAYRPLENGVDHSLFSLYKYLAVHLLHHNPLSFHRSLSAFLLCSALGGLLLYVLRIRKLPLLNQVLILTIVSIYFTAFSGDGTLIHLYYPCVMLFFLAQRAWQQGIVIPGLRWALGCLVFLLSFESFLIHNDVRFIGPAHAIVLGLLLLIALRLPFGPPLEQTRSATILSQPETGWAEVPLHLAA